MYIILYSDYTQIIQVTILKSEQKSDINTSGNRWNTEYLIYLNIEMFRLLHEALSSQESSYQKSQ